MQRKGEDVKKPFRSGLFICTEWQNYFLFNKENTWSVLVKELTRVHPKYILVEEDGSYSLKP